MTPIGSSFDDIPRLLSDDVELDKETTLRHIADNVRYRADRIAGCLPLHAAPPARDVADGTASAERIPPTCWLKCAPALKTSANSVVTTTLRPLSSASLPSTAAIRTWKAWPAWRPTKPSPTWVDADIDRAAVALAEMAQQFNHLESYAHVKGRSDKRHAMAVTVGMNGQRATLQEVFDVTDLDLEEVEQLIERLEKTLEEYGEQKRNIILAALAELSSRFLDSSAEEITDVSEELEAQ